MSYLPAGPTVVVVNVPTPYTVVPPPPAGSIITWFTDGVIQMGQGMITAQIYWTSYGPGRVGVSVQQTQDINPEPPEWITIVVEPDQP
jgi:hypothetical protein